MSSPGTFSLLYQIQTVGLDGLDKLAQNQRSVGLEAKYSQNALKTFDDVLKSGVASGTTYRETLNQIAKSYKTLGNDVAMLARDVLKADRERAESAKSAEQSIREELNKTLREREAIRREALRQDQEFAREQARIAAQQEREQSRILRGGSTIAGGSTGRVGRGISIIGGGKVGLGIGAAIGVGTGLFEMVKQSEDAARNLQNLSDELGLTIQQAYQLQAAANIAGVELGNLAQFARRMGEAAEDPAGGGKQVVKVMNEMGISIRKGPGAALEDVLQKLKELRNQPDRLNQINLDLAQVAGRGGPAGLGRIAEHMDDVTTNWDKEMSDRLVESRRAIAEWGNGWTLAEGRASAALVNIYNWLRSVNGVLAVSQPFALPNQAAGTGGVAFDPAQAQAWLAQHRPGAPNVPDVSPWNQKALEAARGGANAKLDISEQIADARKKLEDTMARTNSDKASGGRDDLRKVDQAEEMKARNLLANLEARQKAIARAQSLAESFPEFMASWNDRAANTLEGSAVGRIDDEYQRGLRKYSASGLLTPQNRSRLFGDYAEVRAKAVQEEADKQKKKQDELYKQQQELIDTQIRLTEDVKQGMIKDAAEMSTGAFNGTNTFARMLMLPETPTAPVPLSAADARSIGLTQLRGQLKMVGIQSQPGQEGILAANQLQMKLQTIDLEKQQADIDAKRLDDLKQQDQLLKNRVEATKQALEAEQEYQEKIAEMQKEQHRETGQFLGGWLDAATSGRPNAGSEYLKQYGRGLMTKIVSNFGEKLPFTMNSASLGSTGALGADAEHPNFLGKLLAGTPLGFDPTKSAMNPLKLSQDALKLSNDDLRHSVDALTGTLGGKAPASTAGGSPSTSGGSLSPLVSATNMAVGAIQSRNPLSLLTTLANLFPGLGGSGTNAAASATGSVPSMMLGPTNMLPPVGGGRTWDPSDPYTSLGLGMPTGQPPPYTRAMSGLAKTLGGLTSGAGFAMKGGAFDAIFNGTGSLGPGMMTTLTGTQRLGAGLTAGGAAAAGVIGAVQDFSKGGAARDINGIADLAMAAAPFAGPAAPFLEAGATMLKLVTSLFPDPRQQRIDQEQKRLLTNQFIRPAAQDYTFSGTGSGGFSYGYGGSIQAGGPTHNYNITFAPQAMDARSFNEWMAANPQSASQALLIGLQAGSLPAIQNEIAYAASQGGGTSNFGGF